MSNIPAALLYAKTHEWVRIEGDTATVGISDHAQHELTDVVFVELPPVGRRLSIGEACAVVESVKTASDIYAPVAGEVLSVNPALATQPGLVNSSPYEAGWFFSVKLAGAPDAAALLDAEAYSKLVEPP
jgi:glycine cleavage system H protein